LFVNAILITAGDVLAIQNTEDKTQILFPWGKVFVVELDGILVVGQAIVNPNTTSSSSIIKQEGDENTIPTPDLLGGERQDTAVKEAENTSDQEGTSSSEVKEDQETVSQDTTKSEDPVEKNESIPKSEGTTSLSPTETDQEPPKAKMDTLETDIDPQSQIRRGEAIQIGGQWFRVSSAVKEGTIKEQPARAQAPLSVVMLQDLSKRNEPEYIRSLTEKLLPVDSQLSKTVLENLQKAREAREKLLKLAHGRSGGVASQLLGSHAHAANPTTLAASFGTASMTGSRKRGPAKATTMSSTMAVSRGGDSTSSTRPSTTTTTTTTTMTPDDIVIQAKEAASDPYLALYSHARRHGCTKDVREMYLATRSLVPESDVELKRLLLKHKLLETGEEMRRQRLKRKANVDNDGKPKKRRYYERKNQRMTNTHLEGTEIGAVLRRAQEKQKQGESVGDGGM